MTLKAGQHSAKAHITGGQEGASLKFFYKAMNAIASGKHNLKPSRTSAMELSKSFLRSMWPWRWNGI